MYFISDESGSSFISETFTLPKDWQVTFDPNSDAYKAIDLVACAERTAAKQVKMCDGYKIHGKPTDNKVRMHTATYEVTVHEATTGKELAKKKIEATDSDCPMVSSFDDKHQTKNDYANPPDADVTNFLKAYVRP
jgi:hypothetical protein